MKPDQSPIPGHHCTSKHQNLTHITSTCAYALCLTIENKISHCSAACNTKEKLAIKESRKGYTPERTQLT
jgi:hypothetical protein